MKKRYIISGIIAGIFLGIFSKIWLIKIAVHHYRFEFLPFIIILFCTYLLALKLTQYLVDFKEIEHKSRIEIIFLTVFFVLLFIPMSHISKKNISKDENRTLEKWQPLIQRNGQFNYNFGKNYDSWFSDRFAGRNFLINSYMKVFDKSANSQKKYYKDKKTLFLYNKWEVSIPPNEKVISGFNEVRKFNDYLAKHNIKFYVLLVPNKPQIYPYPIIKTNDKSFNNTIETISKNENFKIIYPLKELKEASKNDYVYFKTDHHWTEYGAFIGYQKLMKEIKKDFPNVKVSTENDFDYFYRQDVRSEFERNFHKGSTCLRFNVPTKECEASLNVDYKYFKHKDIDKLQTQVFDESYNRSKKYYYPNGSDLRIIILGTSMNENLSEILPYSFKNSYRIRNNGVKKIPFADRFKIIKYYKKEILDYKPDILIFCITVDNIPSLVKLFEE